MSYFSKLYVPELLAGETNKSDIGWVAAVLPPKVHAPGDTLTLEEALTTKKELCASFVFSTKEPMIKNADDANQLVNLIHKTLNQRGAYRGFVWLQDVNPKAQQNIVPPSFGMNLEGNQVSYALSMSIGSGLAFVLDNGMEISLEGNTIIFKHNQGASQIHFDGPSAPPEKVSCGSVSFVGKERGCISFDIDIESGFVNDTWYWGFQFQVPWKTRDGKHASLCEWAPFIHQANDDSKSVCYSCVFDPGDVFNRKLDRRTLFRIKGKTFSVNDSKAKSANPQVVLKSNYLTSTGGMVGLIPICIDAAQSSDLVAGFAFAKGQNLGKNKDDLYVTPVGDYIVSAPEAPSSKRTQVLCGLQGSEFISLFPVSDEYEGDRIRFIGSQPSYGYCYPLPPASPVGPPVDPTQKLLDDTNITSWATAVKPQNTDIKQDYAAKPVYAAQPQGAPLFGQDPVIHHNYTTFLGAVHPGTELEGDTLLFPMVPYSGVTQGDGHFTFNEELVSLFERQFISPTRRSQIGTGIPVSSALDHTSFLKNNSAEYNITTPAGQLVTINSSGQWAKILLAQLNLSKQSAPQQSQSRLTQIYFQNPSPELKQAFQTADPMLVIANPQYLGKMGDDKNAEFNNILNIENWGLAAQVGENYSYGNYTNVIIVKGVKGKLYDPKHRSNSLAANPAKWTQKENFGAPNGKLDELVPLSQWMLDYFRDAHDKAGSESNPDRLYFEKFNSIVQNENWTGILILKVNIASLPEQMKGITAGIADPSTFYAHHLAIETGQIIQDDKGVRLKDSTSVYGLIYYCDPSYDVSKPETPVPPGAGLIYDFRLLTLKVLFENSALKHFQSYAQLTLNQLFGSNVKEMGDGGNIYNSIILRGSFQENDGAPVYGLGSLQDYTFFMDCNVFNKIEITSAQMTTRQATKETSTIWFGMTGYLDFITLASGDGKKEKPLLIDLFSFGSVDGKTQRQGLHFSNLGLKMDYPTPKPMDRTFVFDTDEIRFDISSSHMRPNSLYQSFALELDGLVHGEGKDNVPSKKGYLNMITDLRLSGVGEKSWNGLKFRLNLGTPGELAGKVGLNADLLLAWSPQKSEDNTYNIEAGLHMPGVSNGASLLSLQGILKLSWGQIRLLYVNDTKSETGHRFMLLLTDIALKFLGLLKIPPNGSICFYLFGNPKSAGKASGLGWYAAYREK